MVFSKITTSFVFIIMLHLAASTAVADYRDLGPVVNLSHKSVRTDCSHRFRKKLFSRNYFFNIGSVVDKPSGLEVITFSADPFIEMRTPIARDDFGFLLGDQLDLEHLVTKPKRYTDPQLRVFLGHTSALTKVFLDYSVPNADPEYDLPRSVRIDPATLALEEQCVRTTRIGR